MSTEKGYDFYDLLDPPRNQHVFFSTYLDYARILTAHMEAHRLGNHPVLTGAHVPTAAWRAGASYIIERRGSEGDRAPGTEAVAVDVHPQEGSGLE